MAIATLLVYWPGLAGGFLFDDHSNLKLLANFGRVDDWDSFWLYVLSGFSGPTGRPLSYLSFLIDANHWPADPWPFKRTNVLIHMTTGLLLLGLLRSLVLALGYPARRATWIALTAAALWLLHPLWVSTTLYVVQRMAQLATLFVIAGLWAWVHLRLRREPRLDARWVLLGGAAIIPATLLATLSKENGALLPVLTLVLEATILAAMDARLGRIPSRGFRWFCWILLGTPALLIIGYLLSRFPALLAGDAGSRDFTPGERLLTQARILWQYVQHLLLPWPYPGGIFHDDLQHSTGLFRPWTTALAVAGWLAVTALAWRYRRAWPAASAAVLFFLTGHLLESSFINL
ncbi:MAG: hypothetical protein FKY71_13765, partial [Spiribacter salinus]